ncbi:hypothetical protein MtrunA17_Chr1g0193521 [Medicago truncatula]|uniref:Uncharacterized protein n=1 Tax=Medicago truncatula TaxID=3880 RepID=A0A396JRK8_MEDTR|nr:hypothetical protein MtrunA17_Chr1g0193521 [Medicago truncatula]
MNFILAFNFSTNVLKNISDSINCWNRNTVNMQLMNLTIIGSSFNIRTQSFVLATREMVALKNCFLSENGSSS